MNYSSLLSVLVSLEVEQSPSEVHGLLCGLLCGGTPAKAKPLWFSTVLEGFGESPEKLRDKTASLKELDTFFHTSLDQLNDDDFGFRLMLQDEPESARLQLTQLAEWCSGFGLGFGMGERVTASATLPKDTEELLVDFQEIARFEAAQDPQVDESDADEASDQSDVLEIEEFIKVGVLLINEEMRADMVGASSAVAGDTPSLPNDFDDSGFSEADPGPGKRTLH